MKPKLFVLLLACICVLTACHRGVILEIFNNTGQEIIVVSYDAKLEADQYSLKIGQSAQIGIPSKLQVQNGNEIWNYELEPVSKDFEGKMRANIYVEKFQIEKDGKIYAIPPGSTGIVMNLPVQPAHYPVGPQ